MRLESVSIQNFCSCVVLTIPLDDFNPIVGYNNSGKSNVLRAIGWLLRKSVLSINAFNDPAQPVFVEGRISNVNLGFLPVNQQGQVTPFLANGELRFRRRQDAPSVPAAQVRIEVFNPTSLQWVNNPTGLDNAIGALFPDPLYIEAMDDAADDISRVAAKNTIGLLLKYAVEQIRANNTAALQAILSDLVTLGGHLTGPNRLPELVALQTQATTEIGDFFPGLNLHLDIQPPDLDELVRSATISLSDGHGNQRPFTSFGHGAQRAVQMALIKLLATQDNRRIGQGATTLLLVDEPELYLHPQAIERLRDALETLSGQNFQIVFSTHSPLMLGNAHILNTSMMYRNHAGETFVRTKLATAAATIANHPHQANVIFSIQNATFLLFSESVLLVEGKTEGMLVPAIYKNVTGNSLSYDKACLIEGSSSSAIWPMMQVLRGVGFAPKAAVDLDYVFKVAPQNGLIDMMDANFIACKNWFAINQGVPGFFLGTDGFPTRKDSAGAMAAIGPEQAFAAMAQAMPAEVAILMMQLRPHGIWVWSRGAIEESLGIGKNDTDRLGFISTLKNTQTLAHAAHAVDLQNFIAWFQ